MKIGDLIDGEYLTDEILIIARALGKTKAWVLSNLDKEIPEDVLDEILEKISLRKTGYPLQYITGVKEFMGMEFTVREGVFIPRYETETLVEIVLDYVKSKGVKTAAEIGIGSGVISISMAKLAGIRVFGTDVNDEAIILSKENAERLGVSHLVEFSNGEYLDPFEKFFDDIELVVSNPPYVEMNFKVPREVTFEPADAIFSGKDGMDFIRGYFKRYGRKWDTFMEFSGSEYSKSVVKSFCKEARFFKDLDGAERFFFCPSERV